MLKIVLDTNTIISAIGWKGNPRKIFEKCINGKVQLVESMYLLDELIQVLQREKFDNIAAIKKAEFLKYLIEMSKIVYPKEKMNSIIEDPADNKIIECAIKGECDYIITGDNHLLDLREVRGIKIVTASMFLQILSK